VGHALVEAEMQNHLILTSKIFPNVVFNFFLILYLVKKKNVEIVWPKKCQVRYDLSLKTFI
jgi:hypothetical protein